MRTLHMNLSSNIDEYKINIACFLRCVAVLVD